MPDVTISPELLERYNVIRSTVATWQEAKAARDNLENQAKKDVPYPDMERDKDRVTRYAEMLTGSSRAVAAALCLTANLQRYCPATPGMPRVEAALKAIADGLQLQSLGDEQRVAELVRCASELLGANVELPSFESAAPLKSAEEWKSRMSDLLQQIHKLTYREAPDLQQDAWAAWAARLTAFVQGREEPADVSYLRCRAAGLPPGTLMQARLGGAGVLCQASEALLGARPLTFPLGILEALGFDTPRDLVPSSISDPSVTQFFATRPSAGSSTSSSVKALLIIRQVSASRTIAWKIAREQPTLVFPQEKWTALFEGSVDLRNYLSARLMGVLFEAEPAQNAREAAARLAPEATRLRSYLPTTLGGLMLSRAPGDTVGITPDLQRYTVAPASPQEAAKAFVK